MIRTCSTGHTGPIHVNGLRDRYTHAYRLHRQKQFQETSNMQAKGWRAPGLKIFYNNYVTIGKILQPHRISLLIISYVLLISTIP